MLRRKDKGASTPRTVAVGPGTVEATAPAALAVPAKAVLAGPDSSPASQVPSSEPSPTRSAFRVHGSLAPSMGAAAATATATPTPFLSLPNSPTAHNFATALPPERVSFDQSAARPSSSIDPTYARKNRSAIELGAQSARRKSFETGADAERQASKSVKKARSYGSLGVLASAAKATRPNAVADDQAKTPTPDTQDPFAEAFTPNAPRTEAAKRSIMLRRGTFSLFGLKKAPPTASADSASASAVNDSAPLPSLPSLHFSDDLRMSWSSSGRLVTSPSGHSLLSPDSPVSNRLQRPHTADSATTPIPSPSPTRTRSNSDALNPPRPSSSPMRASTSGSGSHSPERDRSDLRFSRRGTGNSVQGSTGVLSAVSALFSSSAASSPGLPPPGFGSRSGASTPLTSPAKEISANEFGALFETTRKRGLSLGGSGLLGRSRAGSNSSMTGPSLGALGTSSAAGSTQDVTSNGLRASTSRLRASTDPKRYSVSSLASSTSQQAGAFLTPSTSTRAWSTPPATPGAAQAKSSGSGRARGMSVLKKDDGETPEAFVRRLRSQVGKADVTKSLSQSGDAFHAAALQVFMSSYDFGSQPLDVALRVFLMSASLPPETQQIDRCMEAFAKRYHECNPGLFANVDVPYVLAFSLVMLSTDVFNAANKHKMTKADYIRNLRDQGVPEVVLEYFFDQISLTPFVFVEDEDETARTELGYSTSPGLISRTASSTRDKGKLDVYSMIVQGHIYSLRASIEGYVPAKSPFSFSGTTSFFNATSLHDTFARAPVLQIPSTRSRSRSGATMPAVAVPAGGEELSPALSNTTFAPPPQGTYTSLKVAKVGLLSRKDDLAEGGRKASSRKWRGWTVVLTGSQLLFFKDPNWAVTLTEAINAARETDADHEHVLVFPSHAVFKPDAVLSLSNAAAIYDASYSKYSHVFRLVAQEGRQYLFQARSADDLNSWLAHINYAASFKTAALRMRSTTKRRNSSPQHSLSVTLNHLTPMPALPTDVQVTQSELVSSPESELPPTVPTESHEASSKSQNASVNGSAHRHADRTRATLIRSKLDELERDIQRTKETLQAELRKARMLAILTPFLRSTRDKVQAAVVPLEKSVRHARIALTRLVCYREVLARELLVEDRLLENGRRASLRRKSQDGPKLAQSTGSLPPPPPKRFHKHFESDSERESFESARDAPESSLTDDELDRLRVPRPAMMQRTQSETTPGVLLSNTLRDGRLNGFSHPGDRSPVTVSGSQRQLARLRSLSTSLSSAEQLPMTLSPSSYTVSSDHFASSLDNDSDAVDSPVDSSLRNPNGHYRAASSRPVQLRSSEEAPRDAAEDRRPSLESRAEETQDVTSADDRVEALSQRASDWNETKAARRVSLIRYDRLEGMKAPPQRNVGKAT